MHPGLVVKLRPSGPWRMGPDSGARNRVDAVYHSDSLYSAVTSAMARLGSIEEWLDATGRSPEPAVCFSSCFPFLNDIAYVVPPRTVWPPASQASSARVRWKSARFVPLSVVQAILAGRKLDENHWTIDGPSECLAPAGAPGPFRTAVRWSAAVDRLTGAAERHATACLEFRPGCGLWTVASFAGEAARDRWREPIKAAFRLLADTGFGGERSRGWGRSEAPEFVEGALPEMILPATRETVARAPVEEAAGGQAEAPAPQVEPPSEELAAEPAAAEAIEAPAPTPEPAGSGWQAEAPAPQDEPPSEELAAEPAAAEAIEAPAPTPEPAGSGGQAEAPAPQVEPAAEPAAAEASVQAPSEIAPLLVEFEDGGAGGSACQVAPEPTDSVPVLEQPAPSAIPAPDTAGVPEQESPAGPTDESPSEDARAGEAEALACQPVPVDSNSLPVPEQPVAPLLSEPAEAMETAPELESPVSDLGIREKADGQAEAPAPPQPAAAPEQPVPAPGFENAQPHWLLSLFTPAPADAVDWKRGDYVVLSRGGRVESPAGSGELKKQVHMLAEGSVLFAVSAPRGLAPDVAPDGFAHPVYRAGFAVAVPLPKGS